MKAEVSFSSSPLNEKGVVSVVSFSGQLDEMSGDALFAEVSEAIQKDPESKYFIFHLRDLEYMNSKSIGHMIDLYRKISAKGGHLVLAEAAPNILDILDLVGVTRVIEMSDTIEAAKVALLGGE